jgi:hypothetical protein
MNLLLIMGKEKKRKEMIIQFILLPVLSDMTLVDNVQRP